MSTTEITAISLDQFISPRLSEIFAIDIEERIGELSRDIDDARLHGEKPDEDLITERDQLVAFRDAAEHAAGKPFDSVTIVPEENFTDFAQEEAEEAGMIDIELSRYMDWDRYADARQSDFRRLDFGDETVYVK